MTISTIAKWTNRVNDVTNAVQRASGSPSESSSPPNSGGLGATRKRRRRVMEVGGRDLDGVSEPDEEMDVDDDEVDS